LTPRAPSRISKRHRSRFRPLAATLTDAPMSLNGTLDFLWPQAWKARLIRVALAVSAAALLAMFAPSPPAVERPAPPPRAATPGEDQASRIEGIYFDRGPREALAALRQDYANALGALAPAQGKQHLGDEIARLEAHTAKYAQFSPLVAIATEWCLQQHGPDDFPLRYDALLPARDAGGGAGLPDVELDNEMVKVLQINWVSYANLTRSETRGYVADAEQITIKSRDDLVKDQDDQETVRVAAKGLRNKS
jgi:hypothetical protein